MISNLSLIVAFAGNFACILLALGSVEWAGNVMTPAA